MIFVFELNIIDNEAIKTLLYANPLYLNHQGKIWKKFIWPFCVVWSKNEVTFSNVK